MTQAWRQELLNWANQCVDGFKNRDGVLGVMIGGSLARGQEWRHSDLEAGILVEERDANLPYFNIISGRGVEAIQLVRKDVEDQLYQIEHDDISPLLNWPIQLWKGRVTHDPTGLLARFKAQFDNNLFNEVVVKQKIVSLRHKISKSLDEAHELLADHRPAAALVRTRYAMNDAILALHWSYGELPRSQNRTDSRLRLLCQKYENPTFYNLYRDVFDLSDTTKVIRKTWPLVRSQVLEITRLWGDSARDFFLFAVDGNFEWRQNAGILTVYRLYIPTIGSPDNGIFNKLDDSHWAAENIMLMRFLGLSNKTYEHVNSLIARLAKTQVD